MTINVDELRKYYQVYKKEPGISGTHYQICIRIKLNHKYD